MPIRKICQNMANWDRVYLSMPAKFREEYCLKLCNTKV